MLRDVSGSAYVASIMVCVYIKWLGETKKRLTLGQIAVLVIPATSRRVDGSLLYLARPFELLPACVVQDRHQRHVDHVVV
jgi:hypothetical protein